MDSERVVGAFLFWVKDVFFLVSISQQLRCPHHVRVFGDSGFVGDGSKVGGREASVLE